MSLRYRYSGFVARQQLPSIVLAALSGGSPLDGSINDYADVDGVGYRCVPGGYVNSQAGPSGGTYAYDPAAVNIDGSVQYTTVTFVDSADMAGCASRLDEVDLRRYSARLVKGGSNVIQLFRQNGAGVFTNLGTAAITPATGTAYRVWMYTSPTGGGSTSLRAWVTTDLDPNTVLQTLSVSDSTSAIQVAGTCAVYSGNTGATFLGQIAEHRFDVSDGTFTAVSKVEARDTGIYYETVPLFGTGPYTKQWQRSETPNAGFANLSGATGNTGTDTTAVARTTYWYKCVITDTGNGNAQITTEELSCTWMGSDIRMSWYGDSLLARDSIQHGFNNSQGSMPQACSIFVELLTGRRCYFHNAGHSNYTANDFITTDLATARVNAAANLSTNTIIRFGANDCQTRTLNQYIADINTLCDSEIADGRTPIVCEPNYFHTDNPGGLVQGRSGRGSAGLATLKTYIDALRGVSSPIDGVTVLAGPENTPELSAGRRTLTTDDLHFATAGTLFDALVLGVRIKEIVSNEVTEAPAISVEMETAVT